jgi:tripartite-type tricarboxylate transporter receptor subunit TctC
MLRALPTIAALVLSGAAAAQAWPAKPIRVVSDSAAGSPGDVSMRLVAPRVGAALGQPLVVETRTGGGGQIAAGEVLRAGGDGHTVLFSSSVILISRFMLKTVTFDVQRDLAPVSLAVRGNNFLLVHSSLPVNSIEELGAYARRNPGKITYSSNGIGTSLHFQGLALQIALGADLLHVPYGAGNNALRQNDFFAGRTTLLMAPYGQFRQHLDAGRVKAVAMIAEKRNKNLPGVPAILERLPQYNMFTGFWGMWGPGSMPAANASRLSREMSRAIEDPDAAAKMEVLDVQGVGSTPQELAAAIAQATSVLEVLVKAAGIKPE